VNDRNEFVVVGLGNVLMSDEAIGVRLVEALSARGDVDAELIDGGTVGLQLLPRLEERRGVLFADAARLNAPSGTVRAMEGAELDAFLSGQAPTAHDVGLHDLITAMRLSGTLPDLRGLVGVQPQTIESWGGLSDALTAALPRAVTAAAAIVTKWRNSVI